MCVSLWVNCRVDCRATIARSAIVARNLYYQKVVDKSNKVNTSIKYKLCRADFRKVLHIINRTQIVISRIFMPTWSTVCTIITLLHCMILSSILVGRTKIDRYLRASLGQILAYSATVDGAIHRCQHINARVQLFCSVWFCRETSANMHLSANARQIEEQELSSCWDRRPFGHNRHGPKIGGYCALFCGGAESPSNTMWPGPKPTCIQVAS